MAKEAALLEKSKKKMLLQPKYALALSSWPGQSTAHKKENRPIKQRLKKTQKAGSSP
jgi:hypothetical protein